MRKAMSEEGGGHCIVLEMQYCTECTCPNMRKYTTNLRGEG